MFCKCLLLFCALFILGAKCDCDGYFECFNMFFSNFFVGNPDNVEYVNVTSKNLPENFVEVKDVNVGDLGKVLSEISSFIHQDITETLKTQSGATFSNINPDTKIYIKTFNYNFDDLQHVNINKGDIKDFNEVKIEAETPIPSNDNKSVLAADTMTSKVEIINKANHKQISENLISETDGISYYDSIEDNSTDYPIIDYVDLYKDVTNEENVYEATQAPLIKDNIQMTYDEYVVGLENIILDINNNSDPINATDIAEIYPWITTIFIKNESKNDQFDYFCDGALLSDKTLITAARCVYLNNTVMNADDILVILGKTSLLIMDDKERSVKVKKLIIHDNFTNVNGKVENDLALLIFEEVVDFNEIIQATAIGNDSKDVEKLVTTAWNLKGEIVPVFLDDMENKECNSRNAGKNMFCAKFGQEVALCPSYGGVFAAKEDNSWYIYGIRSGDTADRGLCFDKHLWFTDLRKYDDWITENWE